MLFHASAILFPYRLHKIYITFSVTPCLFPSSSSSSTTTITRFYLYPATPQEVNKPRGSRPCYPISVRGTDLLYQMAPVNTLVVQNLVSSAVEPPSPSNVTNATTTPPLFLSLPLLSLRHSPTLLLSCSENILREAAIPVLAQALTTLTNLHSLSLG
jgi:hypothetical protein